MAIGHLFIDMNLRETILAGHSKAQMEIIVQWVGHSQQRFDALLRLFLDDEYQVMQRAAWPLSYCARKHPSLINKRYGKLIRNLDPAVRRNTVRIRQDMNIPGGKYHDYLFPAHPLP